MDYELELIDSLSALAYEGPCLKVDGLVKALEGGPHDSDFRQLIGWLTGELHVLRKTDEHVAELQDQSEFSMELSAMLKELGCPYQRFVAGPLTGRFETREACAQLLDYLLTELMATKMCYRLRPAKQALIIPKSETNTARSLEQLSRDVGLGKPPDNVSPKAFFDKLNFKVEELMRKAKPDVLSEPLLNLKQPLSEAQWKELDAVLSNLDLEYNIRRQMLLTRLEVTIQSFQWSDKMRSRENEIASRYQKKLQELDPLRYGNEDTNIVAFLAARADLAIIEKTSSVQVRKNTGCKIQKHVIGSVPDRGGRAHEHAPPPPEMPSWQQQRSQGPTGNVGGNFRGGRGGGGGRGSSGHWQQYSNAPQQQRQSQQFEPRQPTDQGRNQNWVSGSGRVQGSGWTQHNNGGFFQGNEGRSGGGDNFNRGRSNYHRGGSGGGVRR
ncbi:PREDICTED: protein FAM98A [Bactrocera latifrons]|uniref:Protein FAM98A n=1 Tax=Bactrocera latifrons TaxID=174628 RepID=A0A0K8WEH4_BACLA|nr:PREDICTED: protein FAM98A [Bactrocera latifrons]XP_018800878.1 PREDICTED: protein FAM98A [Bactrocera latifrons]